MHSLNRGLGSEVRSKRGNGADNREDWVKLKGNSHCTWVVKHQLTYLIVWLVTFYTTRRRRRRPVPCLRRVLKIESADADTLSRRRRGWEIAIECDTTDCVCFGGVKINIFAAQPKKQIIKQMHFEMDDFYDY